MTESVPPHKNVKRKWILCSGVLLFLAILFIWGWVPYFFNQKKINALAAEDPLPKVTVLQIKPNTEPLEIVLPSSAQAWHITPIWARINGYLLRFLVDIGDVVKEGELLAEIDTPEVDEQLNQAKAELQDSIYRRDIAKITNERWQTLWSKNREAVTKQDVDQYLANYKSSEAVVEANEKNVARLTALQQFKKIYAPFDGIITQRLIDIGSLIYGTVNEPPQELFQIAEIDTIRFFVDVPQTYYRQIHVGMETEVSIAQFPDKVFKGTVTRFAKALDPTARTLLTQIDVENTEWLILAGLFGRIKFVMKPENINFMIPTTALIIRSSNPQVAVVDDAGIVHLKEVRIGLDHGKTLQIVAGLQENDRIILIPSDHIREGVKVDVLQD